MKSLERKVEIADRCVAFSVRVIKLVREMDSDGVGRVVGRQLLRSATSIGANVYEAQGGQSKADFIAKMSIAHKEAHETMYWLRIVKESELVKQTRLLALTDEAAQLLKILSSSLITAKGKK